MDFYIRPLNELVQGAISRTMFPNEMIVEIPIILINCNFFSNSDWIIQIRIFSNLSILHLIHHINNHESQANRCASIEIEYQLKIYQYILLYSPYSYIYIDVYSFRSFSSKKFYEISNLIYYILSQKYSILSEEISKK